MTATPERHAPVRGGSGKGGVGPNVELEAQSS
jgi:hypothetical protein